MAKPKVEVEVRGDTKPLERKIDKLSSKKVNLDLNSKNFSAPLGKIKGDLGEFDKSLAASNARVLAFGASAGAIFAIQKALSETVKATISVEKALAEVNVILGTSQKKLAGFGNALFDIAKKTGSSFEDVALAGGELARQGLNIEKTLKRTSDAMILARLSGLGVEASVNAITAALNGFRNAALDSTKVVDKLIAVDQAFAVSGADLAEALRRVGSTAEGAGVSLDELLGIVTAAQQITARGGAVIGNSFKTIFTRIQRPKVLEALDDLGVKTKNAAGVSLSATKILKNLASTFDRLGQAQQAQIAELVGGVFQINVLKAALSDLGSQYSVFTNATNIAANATGESAARNKALNQTLSAGLNETLQNVTKLAVGVGKLTLEPAIKNVLALVNAITTRLSSSDSEEAGQTIGKSILGGIGKFLSGPGLAMAAVVLFQLFNNLRKFAVDAVRTFSGLNTTFKQQQQLQQGIVNILQQNPAILAQIQRGEISVDQAAKQILGSYKGLNAELVSMNAVAQQLAANMSKAGASVGTVKGRTTIKTGGKATGYVPNFADQGEVAAMALSGMYTKSQVANPRTRRGKVHDGRGGSFMATYNGHETKEDVIGPNGKKGTIIASPDMQKILARGFVPNFALNAKTLVAAAKKPGGIAAMTGTDLRAIGSKQLRKQVEKGNLTKAEAIAIAKRKKQLKNQESGRGGFPLINFKNDAGIFTTGIGKSGRGGFNTSVEETKTLLAGFTAKELGGKKPDGLTLRGLTEGSIRPVTTKLGGTGFDAVVKEAMEPAFKRLSRALAGGGFSKKDIPSPIANLDMADDKSGFPQFVGRIFETTINGMIGKKPVPNATWDYEKKDFTGTSKSQEQLYEALFGTGLNQFKAAQHTDAKRSGYGSTATRKSISSKLGKGAYRTVIASELARAGFSDKKRTKKKAEGYIPNFAGIQDALKRENSATGKNDAVASFSNMLKRTVVVNERQLKEYGTTDNVIRQDHLKKGDSRSSLATMGSARGFVPNFAASIPPAAALAAAAPKPPVLPAAQQKAADATNKYTAQTKAAGGGMEKMFGVMMIASLVTNTLSSATEEASPKMQQLSKAINSCVNAIMALVVTAQMVGGKMGLVIGAAVALTVGLISYYSTLKQHKPKWEAVATALTATVVSLKEQGDAIQGAQAALSAYTDALKGTDAGQLMAAQEKYRDAMLELTPALRAQIQSLGTSEEKQAALGKAAGKNSQALAAAQKALAAQKDTIKAINKTAKDATVKQILKWGGVVVGILGAIKVGMWALAAVQAKMAAKDVAIAAAESVQSGAETTTMVAAQTATTAAVLGTGATDAVGDAIPPVLASAGTAAVVAGGGATAAAVGTAVAIAAAAALIVAAIIAAGLLAVRYFSSTGKALDKILKEVQDIKMNEGWDGKYQDIEFPDEVRRSKEGDRAMKQDANALLTALKQNFSGTDAAGNAITWDDLSGDQKQAEITKIQKAGAITRDAEGNVTNSAEDREEAMIKAMERAGVSADVAAAHINGAGVDLAALGNTMGNLQRDSQLAADEFDRLQAILDANAAAAAAVNGIIEKMNLQWAAATNMMAAMSFNVAKASADVDKFNRSIALNELKGATKLAKQFSSSFAQTDREGQLAKTGANEKAQVAQNKAKQTGSQKMFKAMMGQDKMKGFMEKIQSGEDLGGGALASQDLAAKLQGLEGKFAGDGAATMMAEFKAVLQGAAGLDAADDIMDEGFQGMGIEKILSEQMAAMATAERTRQEQLRSANLQTKLAQIQNTINKEKGAGGGIKAFLDPQKMDKMEDSFNTAVDDFVTANNRGDKVKTGQAAGNLLGNLSEFTGGDMMGPAADKLKDMVQGGLEQSLRGRANARADVLDQASAATGDPALADLANTLRNQDFGKIAATQTALEFKRQKMPDNIAKMLQIEGHLAQLQAQDNVSNRNTAVNTKAMADFLTGGGFSQALLAGGGRPAGAQGLGTTGVGSQAEVNEGRAKPMKDFVEATNELNAAEGALTAVIAVANAQATKGFESAEDQQAAIDSIKAAKQKVSDAANRQATAFHGMDAADQATAEQRDAGLTVKMADRGLHSATMIPGLDQTGVTDADRDKVSTSLVPANDALTSVMGAQVKQDPDSYEALKAADDAKRLKEDNTRYTTGALPFGGFTGGGRGSQIGNRALDFMVGAVPQMIPGMNDQEHLLYPGGMPEDKRAPKDSRLKKMEDARARGETNWRDAAKEDYVPVAGPGAGGGGVGGGGAAPAGTPVAPAASAEVLPSVLGIGSLVGEGLTSVSTAIDNLASSTDGTLTASQPIIIQIDNGQGMQQVASLQEQIDLLRNTMPAEQAGAPVQANV